MKQSEQNQDCCNLDMAKGLHEDKLYLNYPQDFVRASKSAYPQKNSKGGMSTDAAKVMSQTMHAK
jgi:hypothetical protein